MITDAAAETVESVLFEDSGLHVYAILDGASVPGLLARLEGHEHANWCLFSGDLHPEVEMSAPYLARLQPREEFTDWVLREGWGNHWGVYVAVPEDVGGRALRKHLRGFLMVRSPDDKPLFFRYYDPRVLAVYLPTCDEREIPTVFGPVAWYAAERPATEQLLVFSSDSEEVACREVELAS